MLIGIDGNEANVEKRVGISEYSFELLKQFNRYETPNIKYQIYLKEKPLDHMPKESENWQYKIVSPKKLWTQIGLPIYLFTHFPRPDIFLSLTHYAPRFSPVPTAIAIMDLAYLRFPEMFKERDLYQLKNWTAYSAKSASLIFTISNSSKDDIIKFYNINPKKIIVTYLGIKNELGSMNPADAKAIAGKNELSMKFEDVKNKYKISDKFILFVGTLQPRKNIVSLIEAFSLLKEEDLNLVIVGRKGWLYEEILAAPEKFGVEKNVKFLDFVPDDELNVLYKNAICYCLPSLYEGFGLPVLEAMQRGCPVLTSNVSSLPEAGGNAALYFDPNKSEDIAKKLEIIIKDKKLRYEMIKKGYEQIKKFSWEKTAKQTLDALINLGENNK